MEDRNIFLSYCWKDEEIVNKIDSYFVKRGIEFKRDRRDIKSWESIKKFMEKIKKSDYAILVISKNYLESINCMYEVIELMKSEDYKERIITVVLESANIYNVGSKVEYIEFWERMSLETEKKIKSIKHIENSKELLEDLKKIKEISMNIGEFMSIVSDMNNPGISNICEEIFEKLQGHKIEIVDRVNQVKEFIELLVNCNEVETSIFPEDPYGEQKYKLKKYEILNGIHGLNINFYLLHQENKQEIVLNIPDIINVEKNSMSNYRWTKFYLYCKNRMAEKEYADFIKYKKAGIDVSYANESELLQKTQNTYRITLWR